MNEPRNTRLFERLLGDESGSAMTEFVIGLPIFVMIFSGMGMLYRMNQDALEVRAETNAALWEVAQPGHPDSGEIVPALALSASSLSSPGEIFQNAGSAGGIYTDSYIKTAVPLGLLPASKPGFPELTVNGAAGGVSDSFATRLLDDNMVNGLFNNAGISGNGWASTISTLLSVAGARPAFAAGIRYGSARGESATRTVDTVWGSHTYEPGDLDVPAVTNPTWRGFAVGLTRLEFATEEVWNKQIPEFDNSFDFDQTQLQNQGECQTASNEFQSCRDSLGPSATDFETEVACGDGSDVADACEGMGAEGSAGSLHGSLCGSGAPGC